MSKLVFVTGGARSGKSRFAEKKILELIHPGESVSFIATGEAMDDDFRKRIEIHRKNRDPRFKTTEESINLASALEQSFSAGHAAVLECITTWLGNIFFKLPQTERESFALSELDVVFSLLEARRENILFIVSNELGLGLVPPDTENRSYRDIHGRLNQRIAGRADEAYFIISGIPMRLK